MTIPRGIYTNDQGFLVEFSAENEEQGRTYFFPCGGGFEISMPTNLFQQSFHLATYPLKFKPVNVTMDCTENAFPALATDQRWNGWVVPYFTLDVALQILKEFELAHIVADTEPVKSLSVWDESSEYYGVCATKSIDGVDYYNVCDGWCWELADLISDEEGA